MEELRHLWQHWQIEVGNERTECGQHPKCGWDENTYFLFHLFLVVFVNTYCRRRAEESLPQNCGAKLL